MTAQVGVDHLMRKILACDTLTELAKLWAGIGIAYQNNAVVLRAKDAREPFPSGFRSSRLSVSQMRELIDFIDAWGSQNGVKWTWNEASYNLDQT